MSTKTMPKNEFKSIRRRIAITFKEPSLTVQEYKESQDVNNIIRNYQRTGQMPFVNRQPLYGDVSNFPDFRQSLEIVKQAEDMFMALPAKLRAEFNNDPQEMLNWAEKLENRDQAVAIGLVGGDTPTPGQTPGKSNPTQSKEDSKIDNQPTPDKK